MNPEDSHRYDDILSLPHPMETYRPRMPVSSRAAQFAPFAALTGHNDAIKETARFTSARALLDEDAKSALDYKLQHIFSCAASHPGVQVTYFEPDTQKDGGAYVTTRGTVKKFDLYAGFLILQDGRYISIAEIAAIESDCLTGSAE